jgi:ABC-type Fe3+ transport system permease subunit
MRCLWVWASWAWPLPALVLGAGWVRLGRGRYEAALLSALPLRAFVHGVFPILWRHVLVSVLVLFAFFLGDYAVPHACGLIVYATELLLAAESSASPRAALVAALPVAAAIGLALIAALLIWRNRPQVDESDDAELATPIGWARWIALMMVAIGVGVPLVGLMRAAPLFASVAETVNTYGREIVTSVAVAAGGGVAAVVMGAALASLPAGRVPLLVWTVIWAALPGALVGTAVVSAYLRLPWVYDHWGIMVIGYVARFGWIGVVAALLAQAGIGRAQMDAARSDGAGRMSATWRIALAGNLPTLLCGAVVIAALSLSEAATTALVRVPAVNPISLILIEKFHRFEDEILVGISLLLVMGAIPGAVLVGFIGRR